MLHRTATVAAAAAAASPRGALARACHPARGPTTASARARDVAVIGGGVAGLACAHALSLRNVSVTLYDAGRVLGGRASTRVDRETGWAWDHGARFVELADGDDDDAWHAWVDTNAKRWEGDFVSLACTPRAAGTPPDVRVERRRDVGSPPRRYAVNASLPVDPGVEVKSNTRVVAIEKDGHGFRVSYRGAGDEVVRDGGFRTVVLADKNLASERAAAIYGERPPAEGLGDPKLMETLGGIRSVPCIALMVCVNRPPAVGFVGAEVVGDPKVGWIADESSKPGRARVPARWVALSTEAYAQAMLSERRLRTKTGTSSHQEWLDDVRDDMSGALLAILQAAEAEAGSAAGVPLEITFKRAHRWGAAFPASMPPGAHPQGFLRSDNVYAIGDFCATPLGSIQAAVTSGRACAEDVAQRSLAGPSSVTK